MCTETIVDTMLKDSDKPRYAVRRTHRTYTAQFKAELVAACRQPGASIAAVAGAHGMNANVLHRWLKQNSDAPHKESPAFIPIPLPVTESRSAVQEIKVEVRKGGLSMTICWPASAAGEFARWAASVLR